MTTILIVDDSPPIGLLLQEMLSLLGYQSVVVDEGTEGLRRVQEGQPDLILLDVMMPEMNGWMFYEELRKFSAVPVIFITASDTPANRVRAAGLGEEMLSKEVTLSKLRQAVENVLRKLAESPTSP